MSWSSGVIVLLSRRDWRACLSSPWNIIFIWCHPCLVSSALSRSISRVYKYLLLSCKTASILLSDLILNENLVLPNEEDYCYPLLKLIGSVWLC